MTGFNFDKPIVLVRGEGNIEKGTACWMTALSYFTNEKGSRSFPSSVENTIRLICIEINDSILTRKQRLEIIGPILFEPLGTANKRTIKNSKHFYTLVEFACRTLPLRYFSKRNIKYRDIVEMLNSLPSIKDYKSYELFFSKFIQIKKGLRSIMSNKARLVLEIPIDPTPMDAIRYIKKVFKRQKTDILLEILHRLIAIEDKRPVEHITRTEARKTLPFTPIRRSQRNGVGDYNNSKYTYVGDK